MGSLDPRRCATPQAVAKKENGTACGRAGEERSGPGVGGVEAGRQVLADDSMPGRLLGAEADQEGIGGGLRDPPKDSRPERLGGAGGEAVVSRDGVEWSRSGSQTGAEVEAQRRSME